MTVDPPDTLEAFLLEGSSGSHLDRLREAVRIMEPARRDVELALDDFDEDEMAWRDFRPVVWRLIEQRFPAELERVDALLGQPPSTPPLQPTMDQP